MFLWDISGTCVALQKVVSICPVLSTNQVARRTRPRVVGVGVTEPRLWDWMSLFAFVTRLSWLSLLASRKHAVCLFICYFVHKASIDTIPLPDALPSTGLRQMIPVLVLPSRPFDC